MSSLRHGVLVSLLSLCGIFSGCASPVYKVPERELNPPPELTAKCLALLDGEAVEGGDVLSSQCAKKAFHIARRVTEDQRVRIEDMLLAKRVLTALQEDGPFAASVLADQAPRGVGPDMEAVFRHYLGPKRHTAVIAKVETAYAATGFGKLGEKIAEKAGVRRARF